MIRNTLASAAIIAATALGMMTTPADAAVDRTPPCAYEDGSGQARCVWDAKHRGNGRGQSFIAIRQGDDERFIRISHRRAHRLATTNR